MEPILTYFLKGRADYSDDLYALVQELDETDERLKEIHKEALLSCCGVVSDGGGSQASLVIVDQERFVVLDKERAELEEKAERIKELFRKLDAVMATAGDFYIPRPTPSGLIRAQSDRENLLRQLEGRIREHGIDLLGHGVQPQALSTDPEMLAFTERVTPEIKRTQARDSYHQEAQLGVQEDHGRVPEGLTATPTVLYVLSYRNYI